MLPTHAEHLCKLTVLDGTTVLFGPDAFLSVGGSLEVQGTDAEGPPEGKVVFAGMTEGPGSWPGVSVWGSAMLTGLELRDAGDYSLYVNSGEVHVEASRICGSQGDGVSLYGDGTFAFFDTTICDNTGNGIEVSVTDAAQVTLTGVQVTGNAGLPARVQSGSGAFMEALNPSNDFRGNGDDRILLAGTSQSHSTGSISRTWGHAHVPFTADPPDSLYFYVPTTFGPGVEYRGVLTNHCNLRIEGTADEPVVLRDVVDRLQCLGPSASQPWRHVEITGQSELYMTVERSIENLNAHDLTTPPQTSGFPAPLWGNIHLSNAVFERVEGFNRALELGNQSSIQNVVVRDFTDNRSVTGQLGQAVYISTEAGSLPLVVTGLTIENVDSIGMKVWGDALLTNVSIVGAVGTGLELNGPSVVTGLSVQGVAPLGPLHRGAGLYIASYEPPVVEDVVLTGNAYPVIANALHGATRLGQGSYGGNTWNEVVLEWAGISGDVTLPYLNVPYRVETTVVIEGASNILRMSGISEDARVALLLDQGIVVRNGGQIIADNCLLQGSPGTGDGINARVGLGNVVSLHQCDIRNFPGHGIAVSYSPGQNPPLGLALAGGTNAFENGLCGVSCGYPNDFDGDGFITPGEGCMAYEAETGRPVFEDATGEENLMFDNGWGGFCDN